MKTKRNILKRLILLLTNRNGEMMNYFNSGQRIGKILLVSLLLVNLLSLATASGALGSGLRTLCSQAKQFLAVSSMILIVVAAAVYGIGQIMGAETRARAAVWATAMLTGAVIGIVIYLVVPSIIGIMSPSGAAPTSDPCQYTG